MKQYAYSEIFYSMQGEGQYTGYPTAWLRFFLCNLQCDGFGQVDPTNPESYKLPYKDVIATDYERIEDLPVFEYGCDSSYSWSKKFAHLQHKKTAEEIAKELLNVLPNNRFGDNTHLCLTGGEPLLKHGQAATLEIMDWLVGHHEQYISSLTFETNGTQKLTEDFVNYWMESEQAMNTELFFSVSPKLWTVAGEKREKAIKPEVVQQYCDLSGIGQLKFVVNGTEECWNELDEVVEMYRDHNVHFPIWIMPIGATVEGQRGELEGAGYTDAQIADQALARGHCVSARVHTYLWGNVIGV